MIFLPDPAMDINHFVDTHLPSKSQIFSRTGQRAVSSGMYSGDEESRFGYKPTEQAEKFAQAAEGFEVQKSDE